MKLAIIGTGIKARQYIDAWAPRLDVDIIALADPSDEALTAAAMISARYGRPDVALFPDWQHMLDEVSADIDAVYICSPHAYHADQAIAALGAGCDVLLEKPMVMTSTEARRVIDADSRIKSDPEPFVKVVNLGDSSVDIASRSWVDAPDYWDVKFHITRAVKEAFDAEGVSIPYPHQVEIHKQG